MGSYVITPAGVEAANYESTFQTGVLTVGQKEVELDWANAGTVYYTGKAQNVTATVKESDLVNGDEVAVTVVGGDKINVGKYSAAASALTGAKAGNDKIKDASKTQAYEIVPALTSTTVSVDTVTATIDGLTIKLVGYCSDKSALKVNDTLVSAGKLIVNDVEYIIDASDVIELPAEVVIAPAEPVVPDAPSESAAAAGVTQAVIDALRQEDTKVENLETAVPELIEQLRKEDGPEGTDKIEVEFFLAIEPIEFQAPEAGTHGRLKLDIEPDHKVTYKDESGSQIGEPTVAPIENRDIKAPITISVNLPAGFVEEGAHYFAKSISCTMACMSIWTLSFAWKAAWLWQPGSRAASPKLSWSLLIRRSRPLLWISAPRDTVFWHTAFLMFG